MCTQGFELLPLSSGSAKKTYGLVEFGKKFVGFQNELVDLPPDIIKVDLWMVPKAPLVRAPAVVMLNPGCIQFEPNVLNKV